MRRSSICLSLALSLGGIAAAQDMELQVALTSPLGTQTSHKGDRVTGQVTRPDSFKGDTVEGRVTEVRSGSKIRGTSSLNFTFETLQHAGQAIPISSQVKSLANSKGQTDVDEEGRVIRKSSNVGKAVGGTALGGLIGGLTGGAKGAAIGAGAGAAASIILIEVACEGPAIRFDSGSRVTIAAKTREGPSLEALAGTPTSPTVPPPAAPVQSAGVAAAPASASQPDFTALKDDFIPGEKVLLYDDFTDMAPDEAPPHWKVRGAALSLMQAGTVRQATATRKTTLTPMVDGFPKNFTLESEVLLQKEGRQGWHFFPAGSDEQVLESWTEDRAESSLRVYIRSKDDMLNDSDVPVDFSKPVKQALWVQNGRLRFYLNGQKVVDVNQVELPPLKTAQLLIEPYDGQKFSYRMMRIAESTPDFSQTIAASGRYISHGIHFDTDSDRLQPDSAAVMKSVAAGLQKNPNLKLCIEGHTDSIGNPAHNLDLSKRRAEAVKAVLVAQFGVEENRLTTDGLGASKPMDSNDTPQGRAQNRRVEFVRQ